MPSTADLATALLRSSNNSSSITNSFWNTMSRNNNNNNNSMKQQNKNHNQHTKDETKPQQGQCHLSSSSSSSTPASSLHQRIKARLRPLLSSSSSSSSSSSPPHTKKWISHLHRMTTKPNKSIIQPPPRDVTTVSSHPHHQNNIINHNSPTRIVDFPNQDNQDKPPFRLDAVGIHPESSTSTTEEDDVAEEMTTNEPLISTILFLTGEDSNTSSSSSSSSDDSDDNNNHTRSSHHSMSPVMEDDEEETEETAILTNVDRSILQSLSLVVPLHDDDVVVDDDVDDDDAEEEDVHLLGDSMSNTTTTTTHINPNLKPTQHVDCENESSSVVEPSRPGWLICTPIAPHRRKPWKRPSRTSHLLYVLPEQEEEENWGKKDDDDDDSTSTSSTIDEDETKGDDTNNIRSIRNTTTNPSAADENHSSDSFFSSSCDEPEPNPKHNHVPDESTMIDYELLSHSVVKLSNKQQHNNNNKKTMAVKPTKLERIQQLIEQAKQHEMIGQEEQAIPLLQKAFKMADGQVAKIKQTLYVSKTTTTSSSSWSMIASLPPKVQASASRRLQEDWHQLSTMAIAIQTSLAMLYEITSADYEQAIRSAQVAWSIAKKQRKRRPITQIITTTTTTTNSSSSDGGGGGGDEQSSPPPIPNSRSSAPPTDANVKVKLSKSSSLHHRKQRHSSAPSSASSLNNNNNNKMIWYVECPADIDMTVLSLQRLVRRLKYAEETFEQRKLAMERIIQRRNEGLDCLELAKAALSAEQDALGGRHSYIGDWYQLLANLDPTNAREHLLQAYDIHLQALGNTHPRVGIDLILLAKQHDTDDMDTALYYYDLAINVFCHIAVEGTQIVASILNDMAVLHLAKNETKIAMELFHHALDLYQHYYQQQQEEDNSDDDDVQYGRQSNVADTTMLQLETVQVHRNIAECHFVAKNYAAATTSFRNALEIQKRAAGAGRCNNKSMMECTEDSSLDDSDKSPTRAVRPSHNKEFATDESIADTLRRLGKTYLAAQQYDEAHAVLQESAQLFRNSLVNAETLATAGLPGISIPNKQDELAATLYFLAQYYEATESYEPAIRVYNESMQLRLASDSAQRPDEKRNMVHCAMCLTGLANVCFRQGNFLEAHKTYNKALFFCEAQNIPFENPLVQMIDQRRREAERRVAADAPDHLEQIAREELTTGRPDQAIVTLGTAISLRRASMEKCDDPYSPAAQEQRVHMIRLLNTCRDIFLAMGDSKKADRAKKEALALLSTTKQPPPPMMIHIVAPSPRPPQRGRKVAAATVTTQAATTV